MNVIRKFGLLLLVAVFGFWSVALADVDKNKPNKKNKMDPAKIAALKAQGVGSCSLGSSFKDLDANNVRARLFNPAALFWKGGDPFYKVPKDGQGNAIFAHTIWLGGLVDGELHMIGATYGDWELWPGPLDDSGQLPGDGDCTKYDHIYKVTRQEVIDFVDTGSATPDIQNWPWDLGAPVVDGDGNPNNYNLAGGDLPEVIGDQTLWWVLNDMGNIHQTTTTPNIGLEVQITAFAFSRADALNNTTFYKYKLINKGGKRLTNTYFGIWVDPDLGDAGDDYVGSDTTRGIGYVWNGDDFDGGQDGYLDKPPATGYDFFQGPLVNDDGVDNDRDGVIDEDDERIAMEKFVYYNNDGTVTGNPFNGDEMYRYLRGLWIDGVPITFGGNGRGFSEDPTNYMYPALPPAFWSEENVDGMGTRNTPTDRRFLQSAGPFTMNPGAVQEIVYGIVWSQGTDRFNSIVKMQSDDALAQAAFDVDFALPPSPDAPRVTASTLDGSIILNWGYNPSDNNFLDSYDVINPFIQGLGFDDESYTFEGYNIIQYSSPTDQDGQIVGTLDVANGVQLVVDVTQQLGDQALTAISANGTDSGVEHAYRLDNLVNYQDYFLGVQAYAYNAFSTPKVLKGPVRRMTVRPTREGARNGGTVVNDAYGEIVFGDVLQGASDGSVSVTVVDPAVVTGDSYNVEFKELTVDDEPVITYDITNNTTGVKLFDGEDFVARTGRAPQQAADVLNIEGLSFSVAGPPPGYKNFITVANGAGPLDPPEGAAADFQGFPVPNRAGDRQQVGAGHWFIGTGDNGSRGSFNAFIARTTNGNWNSRIIVPYDFEIRFTAEGSLGYDPFCTGLTIPVPFELWRTGIGTPDDPSDDIRMVPYVLDNDFNGVFSLNSTQSIADAGGACASGAADHSGSGANNDPATDWWYWTTPDDLTPGDAGYRAWEAAAIALGGGDDGSFYNVLTRDNSIRRMVLFNWNGGDVDAGVYNQDMPETGTVFRIITNKPNGPGVIFSVNSAEFAVVTGDADAAADALADIAVVPNPYKGTSAYELDNINDVARFTNLPQEATIRVFSLSGTLIRELRKNSADTWLDWDLRSDTGLPIASGMYLVHVETDIGNKVIKFGVIKKRIQLQLL